MKTKLWSLALSALAAASAFAADIYEIIPCDEFGIKRGAYATYADPIQTVGSDRYYFSLRLQVRDAGGLNPNQHGLTRKYQLKYISETGSETYDAQWNRLGIGVFVSGKETTSGEVVDSGKLEYADLVSIIPNELSISNFFDCVFEYTLKPGHFALPVRLAVEDTDTETGVTTIRPANDSLDNCQYHFRNTDKWEVRYIDLEDETKCGKATWSITQSDTPKTRPNGTSAYTTSGDYSLAGAGIYVQTVDFDQDIWEGAPDYWREVPMGDQISCPVKAFAEAAGVTEDTTLYVWSMDESAVKVAGGEEVEIVTNKIGTTEYKTKATVGTIKMSGGTAKANFDVLGVMSNKIAEVVLSSWKGFRYSGNNNTRILEYKTIPVKCGDKPVPSVEISFDPDYPKAASSKSLTTAPSTNCIDRARDSIPLYVTLTQPSEGEVNVGVTVKYEADPTLDPISNRYVSVSKSGDEFFETDIYYTNLTFAAGEEQKTIYVYPLGGNSDTKTSGISFTPTVLACPATDSYEIGNPALLKIESAHAPVIFSPESGHDYGTVSGAAGEGFDVDIFLNDCYRDMKNESGFKVTFGGALKQQDPTNMVFNIGDTTTLTLTGYPKKTEGQQSGTITITEPDGTRKVQLQVLFTVAVEKDKIVTVELYNTTDPESKCTETQFNEGAAPIPVFTVNEAMSPGESLYFFLKPLTVASSNLVDCALFTQGVELVGGQTNTVRSIANALNFLDGCTATEAQSLQYEIVARTQPSLNEGAESILYTPAQKLVINVINVNPTLQQVKVNGASEAVENNPSVVWKHSVSAQTAVPFQAKLTDPSAKFDMAKGLMTLWCFTDGRASSQYKYEFAKLDPNAETVTANHKFAYAGGATQDVAVVAFDKDMLYAMTGKEDYEPTTSAEMAELWTMLSDTAKSYYAEPYRFRVHVGSKPCVKVYFPANDDKDTLNIYENAKSTGKQGVLGFELTEATDEELKVHITVTSLDESGNPGNLELVAYDFVIPEDSTEPAQSPEYNGGVKFVYNTLDGTAGSQSEGFYIKVEATTATGESSKFDYGTGYVYVENVAPTIKPPQPATLTTNRTVAVNEPFSIEWSASDVAKDLAVGLDYYWYDNGIQLKSGKITTDATQTTTLTLTTDGFHELMLAVDDKEGEDYNGRATRTWLYYIAPVKTLEVLPSGPSSGRSRYKSASGRGCGRTYTDSSKFVVQGFAQTWTYSVMKDFAKVSAWGYPSKRDDSGKPVTYYDDGTLAPDADRDLALQANGNSWPSGTLPVSTQCYPIDGKYDNYFYRWVHIGYPSTGGIATNEFSDVAATVDPLEEVSTQVGLDPYDAAKESYAVRTVEAVFSRELYASDNCGDINADGMPDLHVRAFGLGVFDENGGLIGSDTESLAKDNYDEDCLPRSLENTFQSFIPGLSNNWTVAFRSVDEIRGYGPCFNDANLIPENFKIAGLGIKSDIRFTNPNPDAGDYDQYSTLTPAEYAAFLECCTARNWDPTDKSHWGYQQDTGYENSWSPERPTNPALADTDGDEIPDGFEYYVWYMAHVGMIDANGNHIRLTGRRYRIDHPVDPAIIDSDTIASLYDPLVAGTTFATIDTDNDGLTDYAEFALGTNPFDFDTDGDGLPDGYETVRTQTDAVAGFSDGSANPDHDAMAYTALEGWTVLPIVGGSVTNGYICGNGAFTVEDGSLTGYPDRVFDAWVYQDNGGKFVFARGFAYKDAAQGIDRTSELQNLKFGSALSEADVWAIHYDTYVELGFDPRTGWKYDDKPYSGHTRAFSNADEALVAAFYIHMEGIRAEDQVIDTDHTLLNFWTEFTTDPLNADTDGDGAPDGWELYDQRGPRVVDDNSANHYLSTEVYFKTSPFRGEAVNVDGLPETLTQEKEFSGTMSSAEYSDCETITVVQPEWRNKAWPTDQWNADTDGDGIIDSAEYTFIYGSSGCAGGGLNPCSWDTDCDGLPDPWELGFAGTATITSSTETSVSTDSSSTNTTTTTTTTSVATWNDDGMDGTVSDAKKDYDHDGLLNWQEYMVAAMRCWRYDDTFSCWSNQTTRGMEAFTGDDWYDTLVNPDSGRYNPGLWDSHFNPGNYFEPATNAWEAQSYPWDDTTIYGQFYMWADGVGHTRASAWAEKAGYYGINPPKATDYPSCDPRLADTDGDGMDDYYELFHGLNPLLGAVLPTVIEVSGVAYSPSGMRDIVAECWAKNNADVFMFVANDNYWTEIDANGKLVNPPRPDVALRYKDTGNDWYDFFQWPWLAGLAYADADGDNIRNQQEAIFANVQAASTYLHLDPSALWMTDSSDPDSLTYRYYQMYNPRYARTAVIPVSSDTFTHDGVTYRFSDFPWLSVVGGELISSFAIGNSGSWPGNWHNLDVMYSFEENEGYDSDHDFLGDFEEAQGKTRPASDPQDHDDPLRRQAMWFGGTDNPGFLQTPLAFEERTANFSSASEVRQNFLYYTVECWAKPDATTYQNEELQTLVERAIYTGVSGSADESFLRKNFLIGLKGGRWYTKFDSTGTDAKQSVEIVEGPAVSTNWTHVAATYDGEALRLFVNGALVSTKPTSIQPEHGVAAITLTTEGDGRYPYYKFISILVGASAMDANGIVCDLAWKNRSMDYATAENPLGVSPLAVTTIADYGKFYKGYIDEVRIWDGARSEAEIKSDYESLVRYTTALAAENRQDVYSVWAENGGAGTRAPVTGMTELPEQLMYHWAFDHIAGAVDAKDVAKEPAGFATDESVTDSKAIWARPANWQNNWYATLDATIRSTVYTDFASVPWINNTVAHLPRFDTTTLDSFYWSEDYAGATLASDYGYAKFAFSRTHELPSRWTQQIYDASSSTYSADTRWNVINADTNAAESVLLTHRFARRDRDTVGSDLMIFGGAFPKRISSAEGGMWDDQGAADAWAQTGTDSYRDSLPDWWRTYAEENYLIGEPGSKITWDTTVDYNGLEMSAGEAYKRDLAKGMLPDAKYHDEYADTRDADGDSLPDWWEEMYGVQGNSASDADEDPDNDGLSNYAEYVLGEVYATAFEEQLSKLGDYKHVVLNPTMMYSQKGQTVSDYYLAFSSQDAVIETSAGKHFKANEYFGEIVTDHDFMEDWWENTYGIDYTSSKKYDPLADADGDGWSTYAECRASLWGGYFNANLIDYWMGTESDQNVVCRPQPIVAVKATYYGVQDISGQPLVVRTISGQRSRVDATFVVPAELSSQTRYIGPFVADATLRGHMSPGILNVNSVVFERAAMASDKIYQWNCDWYQENVPNEIGWDKDTYGNWLTWSACNRIHSGSFDSYRSEYAKWPKVELEGGDLAWEAFATVIQSSDLQSATVMINGTTKFGTVNGVTGEYELNMSKFTGESGMTVDDYVFRVTYTSRIGHEWPQTVYLSDTRELATGDGATLNGSGYVREGANTIEAFIDLDGDGAYTVGEPFGVVQNVQIGWHKTPVTVIELKDTSHVVPRYDVATGTDDRSVVLGTTTEKSDGDTDSTAADGGSDGKGLTAKIVIRRKTINGQSRIQVGDGTAKTVPVRSLVTKTIVLDDHAYLTEADVIASGKYDLDWKWLVKDAEKLGLVRDDLKTVGYDIEEVKTLADGTTTNALLYSFYNDFNTQRAKPVAVSPVNDAPVYSSAPALCFTSSDETMTAYKLQVRRTSDNQVIFEKQDTLPGRVSTTAGVAAYEITPAIYAGTPVTTSKGELFADGSNYAWRVALYNAKFNADEESAWSDWASFQMDLANEKRYPKIPTGYGNAAVCVRYYGIATNDLSKTVVVEAFENADFTGQPLAQIRVSSTNDLHSITDIVTPNAVLRGIKPGTAYLRAYLDLNDNGQRDNWESWGYLNYVASGYKAIYNPKGIDLSSATTDWTVGTKADVVIYIEDCDVNQNEIPDCSDEDVYLSASEGGGTTSAEDGDKDGIRDADEDNYGTDASMWDTDGDGMPDGWEALFADMDPLFYDAEEVAEDDVMAYAEQAVTIVTVKNTAAGSAAVNYILKAGENVPKVGDSADGLKLYATYKYPVSTDGALVENFGRGAEVTLAAAEGTTNLVTATKAGTAVLVHAQVYEEYGFNPLTAVTATDAVNTKPFTALDKYLMVRYFEALGFTSEEQVNLGNLWKDYSLVPYDSDNDVDGILDGWELYVMFGTDGITSAKSYAKPSLTKINPWNAADRASDFDDENLELVDEYDGGSNPTDPWNVDTEGSGVNDYYAQRYMLKGGKAGEDYDGDGLSNYAEYLISEVFQVVKLDPCDPKTDGSCVDYFRKMGELYLGEIFTDHDQTDDNWESGFADAANDGAAYANRYVYDSLRDADGDGWSNYAEAKAGTNPELATAVGIDGYEYAEHPVPMIEATVTYNGRLNAIIAPLVFKAWNESADPDMVKAPDAIWTVAASSTATDDGSSESTTESLETKSRAKYLGKNPQVTRQFTLGPGAVAPGSVRIYFRDQGWKRAVVRDGVEVAAYVGDTSAAKWHSLVQDVNGILYTCITNDTEATEVGTVDYTTGRITLELGSAALNREVYASSYNTSANQSTDTADTTSSVQYYNWEKLDLADSYVKIEWNSTVVGTSVAGTYYLGDSDQPGSTVATMTRGYVREGAAKFVAFADLDSNGEYTAGEPFGFVRGVDIGWQGAKFSVELTDTHPVFARINLTDGSCDRIYWSSMASTIRTNETGLTSAPGGNVRVRVVRTAVCGEKPDTIGFTQRTVMDKTFNTAIRPYLHEGDFLTETSQDIDWTDLALDRVKSGWKGDMTNVTYSIAFGDGNLNANDATNSNYFAYTVDRVFDCDSKTVQAVIEPYASVVTYNTRPTFRWAVTSGGVNYNSYTAFRIEVLASDGATLLYDSGRRAMPGYEVSDGINYYVWTAPTIVDNLLATKGRIGRNDTYRWRVTVYNAKFRYDESNPPTVSCLGTLTTCVNVTQDANDHEYSAIPVTVKYTGPDTVLEKAANLGTLLGKVRVQAFATADFSGEPVSESLVTDELADTSVTTANGKLYGLPRNGSYYLRAYIDSNGNLKRDAWESWGAAATIVAAGEKTPVGIYIEDADTDDDWLPDAWEFAKAGWDECDGWLEEKGKDVSGEFIVNRQLKQSVDNTTLTAGVSTGMSGAALTVFTYDEVAGLVCNGTGYSFSSVDEIRKAVQKKVQAKTLKITSITLDPEGKKVVIGVGAEVADSIAGRLITKIYEFNTEAQITVKIYKKNSLVEAWSTEPVCTKTVTVTENLDTLVDVDVSAEGIDMTSGFFKVEVEQ